MPKDLKIAVTDDVLPDGTPIAAGEVVCWMPWCMGRMTELWGADAAEFKPERFLRAQAGGDAPEGASTRVKIANPFLFPAFNAGPRTCLGQGMAQLEASIILAVIYRRWEVEMEPSSRDTVYGEALTLPQERGVRLSVRPRRGK